jgi:hypothetical protein
VNTTHTDTSKAAYHGFKPKRANVVARIMRHVSSQGRHGATNEEIRDATGISLQSVTGCANGMFHKDLIRRSTLRRPGASGRLAAVWVDTAIAAPSAEAYNHTRTVTIGAKSIALLKAIATKHPHVKQRTIIYRALSLYAVGLENEVFRIKAKP